MRLFSCLSLVFICAGYAVGQDAVHTSTVTLGAGAAGQYQVGPVFKANYEYRWTRHFGLEAGLDIMLVPVSQLYQTVIYSNNLTTYYTPTNQFFFQSATRTKVPLMIPFGVKGILPLKSGRVELSLGLGAAFVANKAYDTNHPWLAQATVGARVSLDQARRFWIGTTWRGFSNFQSSYPTGDHNFSGTADFGFRFGH